MVGVTETSHVSTTLTVTEAARDLPGVIRRIVRDGDSALLTDDGRPVARLLSVTPTTAPTGRELADAWRAAPHLPAEEAEAFAADLEAARTALLPLRSSWE